MYIVSNGKTREEMIEAYVNVLSALRAENRTLDSPGTKEYYRPDCKVRQKDHKISMYNCKECRCQWPRGPRHGSATARLLGLGVRIPPGAWMSVCCESCQIEVSASDWSLIQRSPTEWCVSECDLKASIMRRPLPTRGCWAMDKKKLMLADNNSLLGDLQLQNNTTITG
jgi:hypothetical protein